MKDPTETPIEWLRSFLCDEEPEHPDDLHEYDMARQALAGLMERDDLAKECSLLNQTLDRYAGVLGRIEGGDIPCQDEGTLRQWAYECLVLGRTAEQLSL